MKNTLRYIFVLLLSFGIIACDGLDLDSIDDDDTTEESNFTQTELAFNVIFSSLLLNDIISTINNDGFIVLFKSSSELDEIQLSPTSDDALVGSYSWLIDDDELQVSYPDATCNTNKTSEDTLEYTATSDCDGGTPDNDEIEGTLLKSLSFEADDLNEFSIDINNNDNEDDIRLAFFNNGTFEITELDSDGDPDTSTTQQGVYEDSDTYSNVVKVDNTDEDSNEYRLFVLLDGSLSLGTLLELRYTDTDVLTTAIIYSIKDNDDWEAISFYDDISIDE